MTLGQSIYRIAVEGGLDTRWAAWFEGLTVADDGAGHTILTGPVADQAALRGILNKLWDLNLTLVSVRRIETRSYPRSTEGYQESEEISHDR
jgi:hypothetical protein